MRRVTRDMNIGAKKKALAAALPVAVVALAGGVAAGAGGRDVNDSPQGLSNPPQVLSQEEADRIPKGKLAYPTPVANRASAQPSPDPGR